MQEVAEKMDFLRLFKNVQMSRLRGPCKDERNPARRGTDGLFSTACYYLTLRERYI
jgi:hypothetical protein